MIQNKLAFCRIASLAFSFVLIPTLADVWHRHLYIRDPARRKRSVLLRVEWHRPLHSRVVIRGRATP